MISPRPRLRSRFSEMRFWELKLIVITIATSLVMTIGFLCMDSAWFLVWYSHDYCSCIVGVVELKLRITASERSPEKLFGSGLFSQSLYCARDCYYVDGGGFAAD